MSLVSRALRALAPLLLLAPVPAWAQADCRLEAAAAAQPQFARPDDPWIYRDTDIPVDAEWLFGELPNGVRYAVRENGVPPCQASIRVAIDAGSLHERDDERGFAHLIEHLIFRESRSFKDGEAIPHFQRLGASLGNDTNATTSPTQTVYKLDLPGARRQSLDESLRLFAGMIQEPALSAANLSADLPIVLAERRDQSGAGRRVSEATRELFFAGQLLAERGPIGTVESLQKATPQKVQAFHRRWYRPENTVVVVVGDFDPNYLASLVEQHFADWNVPGRRAAEPDFGAPQPPRDAPADNPVGETRVVVEPGQARALTYAILRPYEQVVDNLEYNRGLLIDAVALAILNRRLETGARAGGSYLYANVEHDDISRSSDATYVSLAPLTEDWRTALGEVRSVIADAQEVPPTEAEIEQAVAQFDVSFTDMVGQRRIQAGSRLADDLINAVNIREAVAAPETFLSVFRGLRDRLTPATIQERTRALFSGVVIRGLMLTPEAGEADAADLRAALLAEPVAGVGHRDDGEALSFAELPPIGTPTEPVVREPLGAQSIEKLTWSNGVRALLWRTDNEPGRVTVRVRFGQGWQGIAEDEGVYAQLGQSALVSSGFGEMGPDDLDRLAAGRKLSFGFSMEEGVFRFEGITRAEDVADQLYLFAAKLAMPRWDAAPLERAKAAALLAYGSYASNPSGVINRDLDWLLRNRDPRFATPDPEALRGATPERFQAVWSRLLAEGPVEVDVFGDIDRAATVEALNRTFGALSAREPAQPRTAQPGFPATQEEPVVLAHDGDAEQSAAVVAWPTGGGTPNLAESRKLEVLAQLFTNRLIEGMRERAGASYSPFVVSNWPLDTAAGGTLLALAQIQPEDVAGFFAEADQIARELATEGPTPDELARVLEPTRQMLARAQTGHTFWLNKVEGGAFDPNRVAAAQPEALWRDYLATDAEAFRLLAEKYLLGHGGYRVAVLPRDKAANPAALLQGGALLGGR